MAIDREELARELETLPPAHRVAFAASCCERLLPNYRAFSLTEHWGDPDLLRRGLDAVWSFLESGVVSERHFRELARTCEAAAPDTNSFWSLYTSAALDAAAAVTYTLEAALDGEIRQVLDVAVAAQDTVYMYLFRVADPETDVHGEDPALNAWVWHSPLIQAELAQQQRDLAALRQEVVLTPAFLAGLRRSSQGLGLQPFLRGVVRDPGRT